MGINYELRITNYALFSAVSYYVILLAFYIDIGQNVGMNYFLSAFLPIVVGLILMQAARNSLLHFRDDMPNLITALGWCSAFPLLYTWTYERQWFASLICYDFIVGTAILLMLGSIEVLLTALGHSKISAALMTALNFFCLLIPFIQFAYYCLTWHCLSPESLMALYMTNWHESIDWLQASFGFSLPIIFGVIAFLLSKAYNVHRDFTRNFAGGFSHRLTAAIVLLGALGTLSSYLPETSIAGEWKNVTNYVAELQRYKVGYDERFAQLQIDRNETLASKVRGTVIVVIGESASRDYMKAFNPNCEFDDTPWLSARTADEGFLIFKNAYASWSQTVPVLQRALTEQSQYNQKEFYDSVSILDVAKKAGYRTYWFSNQGRYGEFDSATTLVAKTADESHWTDDAFDFSDMYDIELMKYLKTVDGGENNFIVLHLIGSHIYYNNRYPREFKRWVTADGTGMALAAEAYANTILYTDYVLSEIFEYAKSELNLQAMIYFSDHGENLKISHNPDVFSFDMVRIPMWIWLSEEYRAKLPDRSKQLLERRDQYFTNDMMYDTIGGILNARSNKYEARQDFSSADYAFNRENLTTMLGRYRLTDDPDG